MSSSLAMLPTYPFAVYTATKSAVKSFSDCIREELDGYGIKVSTVLPGPYGTEFNQVANIGSASFRMYDISKLAQSIVKLILKPRDNLILPKKFGPLTWFTNLSKKFRKMVTSGIAAQIMAGKLETDEKLPAEAKIVKTEIRATT